MAVVYAVSEFTDEKGTDWKVKIVDGSISTGDLNHPFVLGPDGYRLEYAFDNFDRSKPILGSKVSITLFHNDSLDTAFNTLYSNLDTAIEGTYRLEIYRDPDGDNETWWVGTILPEQTIIPDEYPSAAVSVTAVDGLGNLKGIKYNNDGDPYEGSDLITAHLYKALSKVGTTTFWGNSDILLRFYEDFIGAEYLAHIGSGQNQQLQNAKVRHETFYNKRDDGQKKYYSVYEVLESFCVSFNACLFMAQGSFWLVPLGNIQNHAANGLKTFHQITGNGTVTYNSSFNLNTYLKQFGNDNSEFEKLAGWERTSVPAFTIAKKTRDYQGTRSLIGDSNYTKTQINADQELPDEDIEYNATDQFQLSSEFYFGFSGLGYIATESERVLRMKLSFTLKTGDGGGTVRYLKRDVAFNAANTAQMSANNYTGISFPVVNPADPLINIEYQVAQYQVAEWSASASVFEYVSPPFDKSDGTVGMLGIGNFNWHAPINIVTPVLGVESQGLIMSCTLSVIDYQGTVLATEFASANYWLKDFKATKYSDEQAQEFDSIDITATNPNNARFQFDQGTTFIGDRISDLDLGVITISNGSNYVEPSQWTSSLSSTSSLGINALGARERMAANLFAIRSERGTLFRTGADDFIHPYTILKNTYDSNNFYQVTGLKFIAARCEYDIECMFLQRNITGITVATDNPILKGPKPIVELPNTKLTPGNGGTIQGLVTKSALINTDDYGITGLKITNGSSGTNDIFFPTNLATNTQAVGMRSNGTFVYIANGTAGQVLAMNPAATGQGFIDAPGAGWLGSTTRIKILPRDFVANDVGRPLMIEDDDIASNELYLHSFNTSSCFAYVAIPTGYTATHARIYGSDTSQVYKVYSGSIDSKTIVSKSAATAIGTEVDITDVASDTTNYLVIKVDSDGSTDEIHGGYITITAS